MLLISSILNMFKKLNTKVLIILVSLFIILCYSLISSIIENKKIKNLKYTELLNLELLKKQEGSEIVLEKSSVKLSNNKELIKYNAVYLPKVNAGDIIFFPSNLIIRSYT